MEWYEILAEILIGLSVITPLVVKLVQAVASSVREKNWSVLVELVTNLMKEAEGKFSEGSERKDWVLVMVKASADTINFNVDMDQVGKLVDSLCAMSKVVNPPAETEKVGE
jgi:hypothetical protein